MGRPTARAFGGLGALVTAVGVLALAGPALATTTTQTISSAGPVTTLVLGNDLDCQAQVAGQTDAAFYPGASLSATPATGDCGTFVSVGSSIYGPDFSTNYASGTGISLSTSPNYVPYTPISQSAVSGSGSTASPYTVTASDSAGGLTVSETDAYATGQDGWSTDVTVTNPTTVTVSGLLYHAVDCYLQGNDDGYGEIEHNGAVACSSSPNNTSGGPVEELAPVTAGSHDAEGYYDTLWGEIDTQTNLPGTCDCTINEDNAEGINWDFTLAPGASATYSLRTNLAATGTSTTSGSGSGSGSGTTSSQDKERSHGTVRITLRESAHHHHSGRALALPAGFHGARVRATLHGAGVRQARGTIVYDLYRGRSCSASHRVVRGRRRAIRHGRVPSSAPLTHALPAGRYSWQAIYSGDHLLRRARSACGAATLRITR